MNLSNNILWNSVLATIISLGVHNVQAEVKAQTNSYTCSWRTIKASEFGWRTLVPATRLPAKIWIKGVRDDYLVPADFGSCAPKRTVAYTCRLWDSSSNCTAPVFVTCDDLMNRTKRSIKTTVSNDGICYNPKYILELKRERGYPN